MTSLVTEHFERPATLRALRAASAARARVGDVLAGRTIWCAVSIPATRTVANELRIRLQSLGGGIAAAELELAADALDGPDETRFVDAVGDSDELVGDRVRMGDVVIAHDALSVTVTQALRDRGAHAVWRLRATRMPQAGEQDPAGVLHSATAAVNAYLLAWREPGSRGEGLERIAAAMPAAGIIAAKEFPSRSSEERSRCLAWGMALAEVVRGDRDECVGGRLHPRPTVAAR